MFESVEFQILIRYMRSFAEIFVRPNSVESPAGYRTGLNVRYTSTVLFVVDAFVFDMTLK